MTDFWELEDSSGFWQLEDGTGNWLLETVTVIEAGSSGGRVVKQVGVQLGQRIRKKRKSLTIGKVKLEIKSKNVGRLLISLRSRLEGTVKPFNLVSVSLGDIQLKQRFRSESKLNYYSKTVAHGLMYGPTENIGIKEFKKLTKRIERLTKIFRISALLNTINTIESKKPRESQNFDFVESAEEWKALTEQTDVKKIEKLWKELTQKQRKDLLTRMKLDPSLAVSLFFSSTS